MALDYPKSDENWDLCFNTDSGHSTYFFAEKSDQARTRKIRPITSTVVAFVAVVAVLAVLVFMWQTRATVSVSAIHSKQKYAAPAFYLFCPGLGQCGQYIPRRWQTPPASIAVPPDFMSLKGIAPGAYNPVASHWRDTPPAGRFGIVKLSDIAAFVSELLVSDPFGTGGDNIPYINFQGGDSKVVAITQRQLAFIVANVLMGNSLEGGDGLSATLTRCAGKGNGGFIYSLLSLLAVLSQELPDGYHGTFLIAGTPKTSDESWMQRINQILNQPTVLIHGKDGQADFMSTSVPFQAMTDIAGTNVGGGSQLCDIADSQDESVTQFYSEVLAFSFFVSAGSMLPVPWTLLGARNYMHSISGQSSQQKPHCGEIYASNWLNSEIPQTNTNVLLSGVQVYVVSNAFVAVASKSTDALHSCDRANAINNNCYSQRHHLNEDLALWYQAFEQTMYHPAIQSAFGTIVRRIGTGPWGAGEWHGDSQQYFLTVWLATSLLSGVSLDYYVYNHFCENPANQCFVLGAEGCASCIQDSGVPGVQASSCGHNSVHEIISRFQRMPSQSLLSVLSAVRGPPGQVFDLI